MKYNIEDLGVDHSTYFQGVGVAFTDWDVVFTGIGNTPHQAAEDAIEQACMAGWYDAEHIINLCSSKSEIPERDVGDEYSDGCHHYVALWVKGEAVHA